MVDFGCEELAEDKLTTLLFWGAAVFAGDSGAAAAEIEAFFFPATFFVGEIFAASSWDSSCLMWEENFSRHARGDADDHVESNYFVSPTLQKIDCDWQDFFRK